MEQPAPELPAFKQISYSNVSEINYLSDIAAMGPKHVLFLESLNYNQTAKDKQLSNFDTIADDLYKKIVRQSLDRPSQISRKSKKGDSQVNYYNSNDPFINDEDCCIEKKDFLSSIDEYKSVPINSLQEFYASQLYNKKIEEIIVEVGKRKAPEQFTMIEEHDFQKFDELRKNIRNSILNQNSKFPPTQPQIIEKYKEETVREVHKEPITISLIQQSPEKQNHQPHTQTLSGTK